MNYYNWLIFTQMCLILAFLCSCFVLLLLCLPENRMKQKMLVKFNHNLERNMRQKCPQIHFIKFLKLMISKIFLLFEKLKILTKTIIDRRNYSKCDFLKKLHMQCSRCCYSPCLSFFLSVSVAFFFVLLCVCRSN